jgi:hypothetical protein
LLSLIIAFSFLDIFLSAESLNHAGFEYVRLFSINLAIRKAILLYPTDQTFIRWIGELLGYAPDFGLPNLVVFCRMESTTIRIPFFNYEA